MIHFKTIFRPIVFIATNLISDIVSNGQESTDFINNLCRTKFNDRLELFYMNSCN